MNRLPRIALSVMMTALLARDASAQWNVARFGSDRNTMYTTFGLDPALVGTVGYGRVVRIAGHDFQVTGDLGIAAGKLDVRDFRARIGTQTSILHWRSVRFTGSATFITRGTDNSIYRALDFGTDFTGSLGLYRRGWYAAGEFGFDKAIITHLTHSAWYRNNFYPEAKDGWYLNAGGVYHYGAALGLSLGRAEIGGRFGWRKTENFKEVLPPVYATLGVGVRF